MPIYEYECPNCQERFELLRSLTDKDSEIKCPGCGRKAPKRVISLFSVTSSNGGGAPRYIGGST